jgi:hypothetical protein
VADNRHLSAEQRQPRGAWFSKLRLGESRRRESAFPAYMGRADQALRSEEWRSDMNRGADPSNVPDRGCICFLLGEPDTDARLQRRANLIAEIIFQA